MREKPTEPEPVRRAGEAEKADDVSRAFNLMVNETRDRHPDLQELTEQEVRKQKNDRGSIEIEQEDVEVMKEAVGILEEFVDEWSHRFLNDLISHINIQLGDDAKAGCLRDAEKIDRALRNISVRGALNLLRGRIGKIENSQE